MIWTPELEQELRRLIDERLTGGEIAIRMGLNSRNVVIGKAWRMGLKMKSEQLTWRAGSQKPKPYRPPKPRKEIVMPVDNSPKPFLGLSLMELTVEQCHYPEGDSVPYLFCGQPVAKGNVYCPFHHNLCNHAAIWRPSSYAVRA